tara:strand:+ start:361 stop:501 length:141 start_codon:yes stop_codon:yes gene_type:complete
MHGPEVYEKTSRTPETNTYKVYEKTLIEGNASVAAVHQRLKRSKGV